ncbi:MAG TPA: hypothetical protein DCR97_09045 [Deltaproteobacteria bacterium]|nr:hypothetical protein [Deltaproteobacteria bacterium]
MNQTVPEEALGVSFADWPLQSLPVFVALMFGGTLGGNGTLIGASANVVAAGIAAQNKNRISFTMFARYGAPIACCQLLVSLFYVWAMSLLVAR